MTEFEPAGPEQQAVVDASTPLIVVLGGAGTGKTTCAAAAARTHLERSFSGLNERVLFLSFSRASVTRIVERSRAIVGPHADQIEVTTFHGLAWSVVSRFGSVIGLQNPTLGSPAFHRINLGASALEYDDLIPASLAILAASPAARAHVQSRWSLVVVDEFQDTDDAQAELLELVSADSRVILLGDTNQCIYASFRRKEGVALTRLNEACDRAGSENTIRLPDVSHRDPTGLIPAVATAIMRREFESESIAVAIEQGRFRVLSEVAEDDEARTVADLVLEFQGEGRGVAVFSHHNDLIARLSDGLFRLDIEHEIAGLSDALSAALAAQVEMIRYAAGQAEWADVLNALAVFVTSGVKGKAVPTLARQILDGTGSELLVRRLASLRDRLDASALVEAIGMAADAHGEIGLPTKESAWAQASILIRPMIARAKRDLGRGASIGSISQRLHTEAREATHRLLLSTADEASAVQLMNLYQTKGREADVTIVVLREGDFFGTELPPFPDTSRLLYVVFSRARHTIVVVLVGSTLPGAVAPFAKLA